MVASLYTQQRSLTHMSQQLGGRRGAPQSAAAARMPFGKYKGALLSVVPLEYLTWLATRDDLRNPLRAAVERELHARGHVHAFSPLAARLQQAHERGYFVVQAGREEEAEAYHERCGVTGRPSICVALDGQTATIALVFLGPSPPEIDTSRLLRTLEERWAMYEPQHLPPRSFLLVCVPRERVDEVATSLGALARAGCA